MSQLTPEIIDAVVAACQAGAEEAAGALSRSLDGEFTLSVGEAATYAGDAPPEGFAGPCLAMFFKFGEEVATVILPEATGLTPDWAPTPDATGESKLSTLAQELSMLLMPETLMADDFSAQWLPSAVEYLSTTDNEVALLPLTMTSGDKSGELTLLWPCPAVPEPAVAEETPTEATSTETPPSASEPAVETTEQPVYHQPITDFSQLPPYAHSLLQIEVPVTVNLASKKQSIDEIVDLGPGSIITFEKPCDDPLEICVDQIPIAIGEAVKVGEKFGVRVQKMILPGEKFKPLRSKRAG